MKAVSAAVVLVHYSLLDTGIAAARKANIPLTRLFIFSDTEFPTTQGIRDWRTLVASEEEAESWRWESLEGDLATRGIAAIKFSSGTTGLPKGVCITHHNLVANSAQAIFNQFDLTKKSGQPLLPERWLVFLPLYHAYSQLFTVNVACKRGIPVFIMPKFTFENYLRYIQEYKIISIQLVPPVLAMMVKRPEVVKFDIRSIKSILSCAAPLSSDLQNAVMSRFNMVVCQGWGMTETTYDDGRGVVVDGKPGELWLKGPQIMLGYWKNREATSESVTTDGWFKNGDVAITREDKWWIVGRKKELIKVNGLQVAPAELEAVLLERSGIADAAVVGIKVHDEELPRAYAVLQNRAKGRTVESDIQAFVAGKVANHKRLAGGVKFVLEIPKFASGKIMRKVTKEWARRDAKEVESKIKPRL